MLDTTLLGCLGCKTSKQTNNIKIRTCFFFLYKTAGQIEAKFHKNIRQKGLSLEPKNTQNHENRRLVLIGSLHMAWKKFVQMVQVT